MLIALTTTCRHVHSLILRIIHNRLQIAAGLDGHTLYLECHHPSARLTASKIFCDVLGTEGLEDLLSAINNDKSYVGQVKRIGSLYSRFRPQRKEIKIRPRLPPGDIPGSRTHTSSNPPLLPRDPNDIVQETITVDAQDLFSQLTTLAYLGKREPVRGILCSIQEVNEGTIRVWRDWLAKQCEQKSWTDGEPIAVHRDAPSSPNGKGKAGADSVTSSLDPSKDPAVLWINTSNDNVGIKFRVRERRWRRSTPILFSSDVEIAVSYLVEFEGRPSCESVAQKPLLIL